MKRLLTMVSLLLVGGAVLAQAQPTHDTAVATPVRKIIVRGSGGYIVGPDGAVRLCPNPSNATCAIITDSGGTRTIVVFGRGGAQELPDGSVVYCPDPSPDTCTIVSFPYPSAAPTDDHAGRISLPAGSSGITVYTADQSKLYVRRDLHGTYEAVTGASVGSIGKLY